MDHRQTRVQRVPGTGHFAIIRIVPRAGLPGDSGMFNGNQIFLDFSDFSEKYK